MLAAVHPGSLSKSDASWTRNVETYSEIVYSHRCDLEPSCGNAIVNLIIGKCIVASAIGWGWMRSMGWLEMLKWILVLAILLAEMSVAFAQGSHAGTTQEQQACSRDASRFCRKQLGDDGAVQQCLQQHRRNLTSVCQKVFESHGM